MSTQALPLKGPITRSSTVGGVPRVYTAALTVAGSVPTPTELATALAAAYSAATPVAGDLVNLTHSGAVRFRAAVMREGTASGWAVVSFTVGGTTYFGHLVQTGLW